MAKCPHLDFANGSDMTQDTKTFQFSQKMQHFPSDVRTNVRLGSLNYFCQLRGKERYRAPSKESGFSGIREKWVTTHIAARGRRAIELQGEGGLCSSYLSTKEGVGRKSSPLKPNQAKMCDRPTLSALHCVRPD